MENMTIDDTLLTGSEGITLFIDEKTLAGTPAPIAASTVVKPSQTSRPRALRDNGGSFLNSKSPIITEVDSDGSGSDRSSLGLLPSNCLLEIENDLLREGSICLIKDAVSADSHTNASSSSVNNSKKNQLTDSQSSREYTCNTNEFLTTVKKCPQAGAPERDAGRYVPQALFQSVQEVDESRLNSSNPGQTDPQVQHTNKWDTTGAQKNADSGMGQATFTGSQSSNGSGVVLSRLGTQNWQSSGRDPRMQGSEVWGSSETQKNGGDSGMGQATFAASRVSAVIGALFGGLGIPVRQSAGRDNFHLGALDLAHSGDDGDADQSVYESKLDDEDLEKLENSFSDFDNSSDEDCVDGDIEKQELRINAGPKDDDSAQPRNLLSKMDGPFKVPLPLTTPSKFSSRMFFGNQPSAVNATPCKEHGLQATFDVSQFPPSGSTSEWGPSIDFGSSTRIGEASNLEKDSDFLDQENQKHTFTRDPAEPMQPQVPSSGKLPADGGSRMSEIFAIGERPFGAFPDCAAAEVFASSEQPFSSYPVSKHKSTELLCDNPFGNFAEEFTAGEFGDEDFLSDEDAAAAMLAEDEKFFQNDHLSSNEVFNLTQLSVRDVDQTFMNMTIGTYMAAGSGEMGSLNSHARRPDIGMPVMSPPSERFSEPILSPDKIFRSPDGDTTQQKTDGSHKCFRNALFSLDNTDSSEMLEDNPQKKSLIEGTQETSFDCDLSSFLVADSQKHRQNVCAKTSSKVEPPSSQTPVDSSRGPHSEVSTKGDRTGDLKSTSATEELLQAPSSVSKVQNPPRSLGSEEADHDSTLTQAEMFVNKLEDETHNSSSNQLTFSHIYNIIEGTDISVTTVLLSEYNKMVKEKQSSKQSKEKTNKTAGENVPDADKPINRPLSHLPDIAKTSGSATPVTSQRKGELNIPVQAGTPAGTDVPELEFQQSKYTTHNKETLEKRYARINEDAAAVLPISQTHKDHHQSSERKQFHQSSERQQFHQSSESQQFHQSSERQQFHQSSERQQLQQSSERQQLQQSSERQQLQQSSERQQFHQSSESQQLVSSISEPQIHPLQSQREDKMLPHKISSSVTNVPVRQVHQKRNNLSPARVSQQITATAKPLETSRRNYNYRNILPEKVDRQQQNLIKLPGAKSLSAAAQKGHQTTLQSVSEESMAEDCSLESFTINSSCSEIARSTKPVVPAPKTLPARPTFLQEKVNQLSVVRVRENKPSLNNLDLLLNDTTSTVHGDVTDVSQFLTLMHDNSRSVLDNTEMQNQMFVSSTPYITHGPGRQRIANMTQMTEKSILPVVTPQTVLDILEVPETVCIPEVCCVNLSLQSSFVVKNLLDRGVRCKMNIGEVTFNGRRINSNLCPFELKGQVVLSPSSTQILQVMFRPKNQGEYTANVEIFSQNMTNQQENRTYVLHLSGCSEEPALQISSVNDEIDFGEMTWGSTCCRSINIKNVGRAKIPLRCSIFRKESALCNFTFHPENVKDVSSISMTTRPATLGTVYSLSLPGKKDGQKILMETINIYCCTKEPQNLATKYREKAEKFSADLTICVDVPIEDVLPLCKVSLQATAGMYKLHVDRDNLPIVAVPGKSGQGTVQIINSGNISMPVNISLEPWRGHFSISAAQVCVPAGENCPVHVTFIPQPTRDEQGDNIVKLMLETEVSQSFVTIIGKIKAAKTHVRCNVSAVNFGGVDLGQVHKQKLVFFVDNDDSVKVCLKDQGSAFKLLNQDGNYVDSFDITAKKDKKYEVFVCFHPSEVRGYSVDLLIQVLYTNRYTIPVNGYGGRSQLLFEEVHQTDSGSLSLDIGRLQPEQTAVRKLKVRNVGVRACYIKASLYDASRQAFASSHASVLPASLILPANGTCEFFVTMNPSKKEAEMCLYESIVVAILKLTWGDEVARQHFILHPGQQSQKLVHDFDIALTCMQKELVQAEMKGLHLPEDSYSALKKGMTVNKIGLYAVPLENNLSPAVNTTARGDPYLNRPAPSQRPVLTPVDANIKPVDSNSNKKNWGLNPTEFYFTGGDKKVSDSLQVINFYPHDLQYSVEFDNKYITVAPSKGIVPPKNTALLEVYNNLTGFSTKESTYSTVIRVSCLQQTQLVKVNIKVAPDRQSPKPATPAVKSTTAGGHASKLTNVDRDRGFVPRQLSGKFSEKAGRNSPVARQDIEGSSERIQGSESATVGTTESGARRDGVYDFTNVSAQPLTWKLAPFASPYVTLPDNPYSLFRVDYEVFQLSPLGGALQPNETQKVHILFSPQSEGSYNHTWCIYDTADSLGSFHRFTIYATASSSSPHGRGVCEQGIIPQGLSPTVFSKSRAKHIQKSLGTSRSSPVTSVRTFGANKPLGTGSSLVHGSTVGNRISRSGGHPSGSSAAHRSGNSGVQRSGSSGAQRSSSSGASPALVTRSGSAVQRPTSPTSPGVSWVPVSESENALPVRSQTLTGGAVTSRSAARGTVGSYIATKDTESPPMPSDLLKSLAMQESNSSRSGSPFRSENGTQQASLILTHKVIKFPQLNTGECSVLKICLNNTTEDESQVVVEQAPKPPFQIKHYSFIVRKNKMVKFPVTYKPRHVGTFQDVVVFREEHTGNTVTATLLAECVNTPADTSSDGTFSQR